MIVTIENIKMKEFFKKYKNVNNIIHNRIYRFENNSVNSFYYENIAVDFLLGYLKFNKSYIRNLKLKQL